MDLKRLQTFVAVVEQGTVSKAGELLHTTQPALSRQIGSLEAELGFALFERLGRRLRLTARGEQLFDDCRTLVAHGQAVKERAQALQRGETTVLKIAASALTIEGAFSTFLQHYARRVPDVRLLLVEEDDAAEHLNMLERGEVHLSVNAINLIKPDEHRFASYRLPSFQVLAACAPSLGIERGSTIDIGRVVEHPLLVPNGSATRHIFDAACRIANLRPNVFLASRAAHVLLTLARVGHGVAIVPSILNVDSKTLHVMRVTHRQEPLHIELAVLWDKRRALPRYAREFSELLDAHLRRIFPDAPPARKAARPRAARKRRAA
jgi:LysR family transcriptional regulator, nitrogen assimilation regulatory protein